MTLSDIPGIALSVALMVGGCAYGTISSGKRPERSPSLDYPPPPVETSDGQVLGADGVRIEDKLRESPRLGSDGAKPAESPPRPATTAAPARGREEDPICASLGLDAAVRKQRCPPSTTP